MSRLFDIDDLRKLVARALVAGDYHPSDSGRIRAVPDTRTIRYYTTIGLIDRAAEMRGRTAFYNEKHLLQLVAIKRLQAEDKTLAQIQQQLSGISPKKLRAVAELPAKFWDEIDRVLAATDAKKAAGANDADGPSRRRQRGTNTSAEINAPGQSISSAANNEAGDLDVADKFWTRIAELPGSASLQLDSTKTVSVDAGAAPTLSLRIPLSSRVQILIEHQPLSAAELPINLQRLRDASVALLAELSKAGLQIE